jgi:hypothetical protein
VDPLVLARSFIHLSGKHANIICDFVILVCLISCTNFISQDLVFVYKLDNICLSRDERVRDTLLSFAGCRIFKERVLCVSEHGERRGALGLPMKKPA